MYFKNLSRTRAKKYRQILKPVDIYVSLKTSIQWYEGIERCLTISFGLFWNNKKESRNLELATLKW